MIARTTAYIALPHRPIQRQRLNTRRLRFSEKTNNSVIESVELSEPQKNSLRRLFNQGVFWYRIKNLTLAPFSLMIAWNFLILMAIGFMPKTLDRLVTNADNEHWPSLIQKIHPYIWFSYIITIASAILTRVYVPFMAMAKKKGEFEYAQLESTISDRKLLESAAKEHFRRTDLGLEDYRSTKKVSFGERRLYHTLLDLLP